MTYENARMVNVFAAFRCSISKFARTSAPPLTPSSGMLQWYNSSSGALNF